MGKGRMQLWGLETSYILEKFPWLFTGRFEDSRLSAHREGTFWAGAAALRSHRVGYQDLGPDSHCSQKVPSLRPLA